MGVKHGFGMGWALTVVAFTAAVGAEARIVEENLCTIRPAKKASWCPQRTADEGCGFNSFRIVGDGKSSARQSLSGPLFPKYCASGKVRISFRYRSSAKDTYLLNDMGRPDEKVLPGYEMENCWLRQGVPVADDWTDFVWETPRPRLGFCWGNDIACVVVKDGTFEAKDVRIEEIPPEHPKGKAVTVGGARIAEIAILTSDDEVLHVRELVAARMLRYALFDTGYDYLPIRTAKDVAEIGANAIVIGTAAEKLGFFSADELAKMKNLSGIGAYRAKGTRLGITGDRDFGTAFGAFLALRGMGVEYLGGTQYRKPAGDIAVRDGFEQILRPAIPFRQLATRHSFPELRGSIWFEGQGHALYNEGSVRNLSMVDHSMPLAIAPVTEYFDAHPEWSALQADGTRLGKETSPWELQYCLSDPEFAKFVGRRMDEMMDLHPECVFFMLAPGDGAGKDCKCTRCKAMGSTSDVWVQFANRVAEITSVRHPDRIITMYSYVDTPEPPLTTKPHQNVIFTYCVYPSEYWPSCMIWDHPVNAKGREALDGWRKIMPRIGLTLYPSQCGEWMTFWPGFDNDMAAVKEFSGHGAISTRYFMHTQHGTSIPGSGSFTHMRTYLMERLEEDPSYDFMRGAKDFIRDFYGPAAKPMWEYFKLSRAEPKRRDWVQRCEQHLKGFVTKEFASKAFVLLDAAETAAKDDPARLYAVRQDKVNFLWSYLTDICRGRGNVSTSEFPAWAKRFGEFCRLCRDTGITYMGSYEPHRWFRDTAFIELPEAKGWNDPTQWVDMPQVKAIIANPEKGLGVDFPNLQKRVGDSIVVPAEGMVGGERIGGFWRRKDEAVVRCVRRPTSGLGLVFTRIDLDDAPTGESTLYITGIDNEKKSVAEMELVVNGKSICRGKVPFGKDAWTECPFRIPAGTLIKGENEIQIKNITVDTEKDGECGDRFVATRNYFWGWFLVEKLRLSN